MKRLLLSLLFMGGVVLPSAAQQLPNGNFDGSWEDCVPWTSKNNTSKKGTQPEGWTISHVIGMSGTGATEVGGKETGQEGYAVKLINTANPYKASQIVPAYLTLGTTWATSKGGAISDPTNKDGGTFGGMAFTNQPDALRFYYKRTHGSAKPSEPSVVCAYLWKGSTSQAKVPGNNVLVGSAATVTMTDRDKNILGMSTDQGGTVTKSSDFALLGSLKSNGNHYVSFATSDVTEWTEFYQEFTYSDLSVKPEKINIIVSANDYFGGANAVGKDNTIIVDNISLIYYSTLKTLSYNDISYNVPAVGGTLDLSATEVYDESKLAYTLNGNTAQAACSYDENTAVLSITVSNVGADKDGQSSHTYYVQFAKPGTAALTDLKYNGTTIPDFSSLKYEYTVVGKYTEGCLTYTKEDGEDATATLAYADGVATIVVDAKYGDAQKIYTVTFEEPIALLTASFKGNDLTVDQSQIVTVDAVYSADNWEFTTSGENVSVLKKYDVESGLLTLIAMQFDGESLTENYEEYFYKFETPVSVTTYEETLSVSFMGETFTSESPIMIAKMSDDTYILGLTEFALEDMEMLIGDIVVDGLSLVNENGIDVYKYNNSSTISKTIQLAPGSANDYLYYLGPMLGDVPLELTAESAFDSYFHTQIAINMESTVGYNIDVTAGTDIVAQTQSAALAETGEAHVVLNRKFLMGWNTICLPFATTPEAVAGTGAKAQAFAGAGADGLDFVVAETMTANTPYLIYVPADTEAQTFIANVNLEEATPASVKYGDFTFKGNYVANMPMTDLYGVADKDGVQKIMKGSTNAKLQGTRAYFDYSGTSSVSGMRINLEGQGDVTSIDGVQVLSGSFDIYNLQGIRVRTAATSLEGLTPGVYVVNGKKVMVK